jgi:nicotinamidase-related amidase
MADKKAEEAELAPAPYRDAPRGGCALVILDMITEMDFAGSDAMIDAADAAANRIRRLRDAADQAEIPVIYVNDNFGEWHSQRSRLVERALAKGSAASHFVEKLTPRDRDYFIIKPQFSGFYATNLPVLLPKLGVDRLVLTGIAADICVLFTAADAHMRDYILWVPEDAVAAEAEQRKRWALEIMKAAMNAETAPTTELELSYWADRAGDDKKDRRSIAP